MTSKTVLRVLTLLPIIVVLGSLVVNQEMANVRQEVRERSVIVGWPLLEVASFGDTLLETEAVSLSNVSLHKQQPYAYTLCWQKLAKSELTIGGRTYEFRASRPKPRGAVVTILVDPIALASGEEGSTIGPLSSDYILLLLKGRPTPTDSVKKKVRLFKVERHAYDIWLYEGVSTTKESCD